MLSKRWRILGVIALLTGIITVGSCGGGGSSSSGSSGSPSAAKVFFLTNYITLTGHADLNVVSISGGISRTLATDIIEYDATPDGSRALYIEDDGGGNFNYKSIPSGGGAASLLANVPNHTWEITDDSSKLVFSKSSDNSINVVPMAGGAVTAIVTSGVSGFRLTPDSTRVVYISPTGDMNVKPLAGGSPTFLAANVSFTYQAAYDSNTVYYIDDTVSGTLKAVSITGGAPVTLAQNVTVFRPSRDSSKMLYLSDYNAVSDTFTMNVINLATGVTATLDTGVSMMFADISRDSSRVVYMKDYIFPSGNLYSITTSGTTPVQIGPVAYLHEAAITHDSTQVVYGADFNYAPNLMRIKRVPIAGGSSSLVMEGTNYWELSPYSDKVVYSSGADYNPDTYSATLKSVNLNGTDTVTLGIAVYAGFVQIR
ncbi:MAG: hypothetical protein HZA49_11245 [Planctomycetes bacterium]|nr:hypothetical protein [Planctomycetota bacterium]